MANYILVENRQIVHLGPIPWRHRFIQSELDDLEVSYTVSPTESGYIRINDNFEIFPVGEPVGDAGDPRWEDPVGPTWEFVNDQAIPTWSKQDKPLENVRQTIRALAASMRYNKEAAGTKVVISPEITEQVIATRPNPETSELEEVTETRVVSPAVEVTADTSRDGRAIFVQVYSTLPDGQSVDWKFPEGWFNITKEQLGMVIAGGFTYIQEQFAWEKTYTDRVTAAVSMEELKDIYDELSPVVVPQIPGV